MQRRSVMVNIVISAVVAALVGTTSVAMASHQFNDVPNGNFFHDEIASMFDAGCYSGFSDGTFGPSQAPTRGQFAFWLSHCVSRSEFSTEGLDGVDEGSGPIENVAPITVTSGGLDNKPAQIDLDVFVETVSTDCNRCQATIDIVAFDPAAPATIFEIYSIEAESVIPGAGSDGDNDYVSTPIAGTLGGTFTFAARVTVEDPDDTNGSMDLGVSFKFNLHPLDGLGNGGAPESGAESGGSGLRIVGPASVSAD